MKKIKDLNEKQKDQFEFFLRAEGFLNIIPNLDKDVYIDKTIYIKDGILKINLDANKIIEIKLNSTKKSLEEKINQSLIYSKTLLDKSTIVKYENLSKNIVIDFLPGLYTAGFRRYLKEKFYYNLFIDIPHSILREVPPVNFVGNRYIGRINKYYFENQDIKMNKMFYENGKQNTIVNQVNYNSGISCSPAILMERLRDAKTLDENFNIYYSFNNKNDIQKEFNKFLSPIPYWESNYFKNESSKVKEVISLINLPKKEVEDFYRNNILYLIQVAFEKKKAFMKFIDKNDFDREIFKELINKEDNSFFKNIFFSKFNELLENCLYDYLMSFKINQLDSCPKNLREMIKILIEKQS